MVEIVLTFGLMMSLFEFVLVVMLPVRVRLRLLGNASYKMMAHMGMLLINLWVHWGTVTGTMSATLAFIASLGVLEASTRLFGKLVDGRYYTIGLVRYNASELK